jgi:hypothetical protein
VTPKQAGEILISLEKAMPTFLEHIHTHTNTNTVSRAKRGMKKRDTDFLELMVGSSSKVKGEIWSVGELGSQRWTAGIRAVSTVMMRSETPKYKYEGRFVSGIPMYTKVSVEICR